MGQENLRDHIVFGSMPHVGESSTDYRERMAAIQAEALARRQQELHEQSSPLNTPSARIKIWERLHQLEMPRNPAHPLIAIIATNTGLSTDEVHAEQRSRSKPPAAPAATAVPGAPTVPAAVAAPATADPAT